MQGNFRSLSRHLLRGIALFILGAVVALPAFGYSGGPPDGKTGAPGEGNCTDCHSTYPLNSGDGTFLLMVVEGITIVTEYTPGNVYDVNFNIMDPGQSRWGFELTSLLNNGNQGGTITVTSPMLTQLSVGSGDNPDYLKHTSFGTIPGSPGGIWTAQWTAPPVGSGPVTFYIAFNAANNNNQNSGDYVYTHSLELPEGSTGVIETPVVQPTTPLLLHAYPNPFNPTVTLNLAQIPGNQPIILDLMDVSGRIISHLTLTTNGAGTFNLPLNLEALPSGKYLVRALTEQGSAFTTIVKVK